MKTDSTGTNISTIINKLSNSEKVVDTTKKTKPLEIKVQGLELDNFAFTLTRDNNNNILHNPNSIDFADIDTDSIYLKATGINLVNDTLFFTAEKLSLREKSGYHIQNITANCYIVPGKEVYLEDLTITDDFSDIALNHFSMTYNGGDEFSDFVEKVVLSGDFVNSEISFHSIGYFAAVMQNIPIKVKLNGLITGPVSNFRSNNLTIEGFSGTYLNGRFSMTGLPEIDETFIFADFNQLRTNPKDFTDAIISITGNPLVSLDEFLSNVNQVNFKGSFTGLYNDFVANGSAVSNLGTLNLDVLFKTTNQIEFSGHVSTPSFDAGQLLRSDLFGFTSFDLRTNGSIAQQGSVNIFSEGTFNNLYFNQYNYQNIKVSGTVKENEFSGSVNVKDAHIDLDFLGRVMYKAGDADSIPVFDFNANVGFIDLAELNFNKRDSISTFEGIISANFQGDNITNFTGELKITDASYSDMHDTIKIGNVSLTSQETGGQSSLHLESDFVEADYIGIYAFGKFISEIRHVINEYLPVLENIDIHIDSISHQHKQQFVLHVKTKESTKIARIFVPGLYIAPHSDFNLVVDNNHGLNLHVDSENITLGNNVFNNIEINAYNTADSLFVDFLSTKISSAGLTFQNVQMENTVVNNTVGTRLSFINDESAGRKNTGNFYFRTNIGRFNNADKLGLNINLQQSSLVYNDSIWWLPPSTVQIDSGRITVDNFKFYKRSDQYLAIDGSISHDINDTLFIKLNDYDLKAFNYLTASSGFVFDGSLSGSAEISGIYDIPIFLINISAQNVSINNDTLGNITVASEWDNNYDRLNMFTSISNNNNLSRINGYIAPKNKEVNFDINLNKFNFGFIEPFTEGIISDIEGTVTGKLSFKGELSKPDLTGEVTLEQTSLLVDYLQTRYKLEATIDVSPSLLSIKNGTLYDMRNNGGKLSVDFRHNLFRDINFEATASITNMLALNTKKTDNQDFYGTAYVTGVVEVKGTPDDINFDVRAQSENNSVLYIPLSTTSEAKEISMLTFKQPDTTATNGNTVTENGRVRPRTHIGFGLDLLVTPETEVQLLINEQVGDILRAQGQGNLKINVDPSIDLFSIVGDYQVTKGEYNFTLPSFNFISRKFTIDEGSQINFNGDVTSANLNVQASYKPRGNISLAPLIPGETTQKRPVNCIIYITGKMAHPNLRFDIEFPNLDPEAKAQAMSALNTQEKITNQFLALMVMNSFMPEQQYANNTNYGTTAVLSNATDLLSGQISNLVGMLNLPIDLDVDFGMDENQQISDFEVMAQMMLWNRVILNGSFGNNTQQPDRQLVGDFEMDILLGTQGKYRLKVFTRSSDYFTNDLEYNMQGVGMSYQTEFNNFRDLLGRRKKKSKKRNYLQEAVQNSYREESSIPDTETNE